MMYLSVNRGDYVLLCGYLKQSRHRGNDLLGQAASMRFLLGSVRPHISVSAFRTPCRTPFARLRDSPPPGRSGSFTGLTMPDRSSETAAMRESSPEDASSVSTRTGEDEDESELEEGVATTAASLVNLPERVLSGSNSPDLTAARTWSKSRRGPASSSREYVVNVTSFGFT